MSRVIVLGSLNEDLVVEVDRAAAPGETILARSLSRHPGGKGANQAVAAARAGANVRMRGAIGADDAGARLVGNLEAQGVDTSGVSRGSRSTGLAIVTLDSTAENSIVVVSGANSDVTGVEGGDVGLADAVFVTQLEIPLSSARHGLRDAHEAGARTVLNAAPAADVRELMPYVDVLVVNETEAVALADDEPDAARAAERLSAEHDADLVLTLGAKGALIVRRGTSPQRIDGVRVDAVDTTGAGDTFVGVLAAELAHGRTLAEAADTANIAAALACTAVGAQAAMPNLSAIAAFREASTARGGARA
ncbi:ribokinase [Microbacterium sp. NPDC087589]|uniref:ribokinase n=1 Tax=Microbacterium sp. NPDC087589 TaxID=3364191 RepID=UPI00382711AC